MAVHGTRSISSLSGIGQEQRCVAPELYSIDGGFNANMGALLVLANNIPGGKKAQTSYKFECFEEPFWSRRGTVTGGAAKNATSITIAAPFGKEIQANTILYVPSTGERIMVTSGDPSTGVWTVIRNLHGAIAGTDGHAQGQGIAIAASAEIRLAGVAYGEGATAPPAISLTPESSYNYTQIFQLTTDVTTRLQNTKLYAENDPLAVRTKKMLENLKVMIQSAFLFGVRGTMADPITGQTITTTGGLLQHLETNGNYTNDTTGIMTIRVLNAWMEKLFENEGSGVRHCFIGNQVSSCLDQIMENRISIVDAKSRESYGIKMKEYVSSKGTLRFICDNKDFGAEMGTRIMALDFGDGAIGYSYLKGCDVTLETQIQNKRDMMRKENGVWCDVGLFKANFGLDNSLLATTGEHRAKDGILNTTAVGGWSN